jgi:multidrug resistance efflux pump
LVRLDDSVLLVQRDQAEAALRAAQANLTLLWAGATDEQMDAAEAQLAQAEANLRMAEAALDSLTLGARPEEIAAIRASLDQARARYYATAVSLTTDQIEKVRTALTTAESNLSEATARRDDLTQSSHNLAYVIAVADAAIADAQAAVTISQKVYEAVMDESQPNYLHLELARLSWETAQANVVQAQARLDGLQNDTGTTTEALATAEATLQDTQQQADAAKAAYEALTTGLSAAQLDAAWAEVQRLQAQLAVFGATGPNASASVETLLTQIDTAKAARDLAAANLAALTNGARSEQLNAAQAQVDAAQAQVDMVDLQIEKLTLTAPWDGVVLTRNAEVGGMALPGATLIEVGRLDKLELTVYLPEEQFGVATPGQAVRVHVDAYPGRTFNGVVVRMADEAEFTPTNVQTKEDRTRLIYAVVIEVDNPDLALKPSMIADVVFGR